MRGARPDAALEQALARRVAPQQGETLVAAVSGGPDSAALAALLCRAAPARKATVVLAYIDHGVRGAVVQDEAVVLGIAAALGAPLAIRALARGLRGEAALREARYAALAAIAGERGARRIVTAHHARDQSESVLLALLRGCGPSGLGGIEPVRPLGPHLSLERPLLETEPEELFAYALRRGLPVARDPSNANPSLRRNALRAALCELRRSLPHLDAAVARCARIA
ncbi:MAG: tRNA lysidine(34) synthetase TilS, partial [Vulcanimicrobiaceae bacterium]